MPLFQRGRSSVNLLARGRPSGAQCLHVLVLAVRPKVRVVSMAGIRAGEPPLWRFKPDERDPCSLMQAPLTTSKDLMSS